MIFFRPTRCYRIPITTLMVLTALPCCAHADETFFAEDLNFAGDTVRVTPVNSVAQRDTFLSRITGAITDTLESQTAGAPGPYALSFGTLSGTGPNTGMVSVPTGTDGGRFPLSGNIFYRQADEFEPNRYSATLTLFTPQRAFAFFATDWGDSGFLAGTQPTVTLSFVDNTTTTYTVPASILGTDTTGSVAFFGIVTDKQFNRIEIVNGTGSRTSGYDDFIVAAAPVAPVAAPEPTTLALFLFPLACVVRRRRNLR